MDVPCCEDAAHIYGGGGAPESNVMITRRLFIGASATALLGRQSESAAQPKLPRIGVLVGAVPPHPFVDAFRRGLRTLGYLEGQNIAPEIRYTRLVPVLINGPDEFERAFSEMAKAGAQAVIVQDHFDPHRVLLIDLAAKYKLA